MVRGLTHCWPSTICCFYLLIPLWSAVDVVAQPTGQPIPLCGPETLQVIPTEDAVFAARRDHIAVLASVGESANITIFPNQSVLQQPARCSLQLNACPGCVLNLRFRSPAVDLPESEFRMMPTCTESLIDPCFDLQFVEDKADSTLEVVYRKISIWDYPHRDEFNSSSDTITLTLMMWNVDTNSSLYHYIQNFFPLYVTSLSNDELIVGTAPDRNIYNQSSIGFIESPRYPEAYPRNLVKKYTLVNHNPNGFIRLTFDDFHVNRHSELQIFDSDGSEVSNSRRDNRRPAALVSKGSTLAIEFRAHDFTQIVGFRARYEFVMEQQWSEKPNGQNCDEYLEGNGGELRLDGLSQLLNTHIDCIWIVGRQPHVSRNFDRIYLKVEDFHVKGVSMRLEVREGASSTSDRLLLLFDQQSRDQLDHKQPRHGFTTSLNTPAYYIRLRGFLMSTSGLEVVYSQFYRWATAICPGNSEFHCDNARCIKKSLRCDGVNHCGDASDEMCHRPLDDYQSKSETVDVSGMIALVVGVCGLLVLFITVAAVVSRVYRRRLDAAAAAAHRRARRDSAVGTLRGEFSPSIQTVGERRFYVVPESQISVIEAPPSYDDAMKHPSVPVNTTGLGHLNRGYQRTDSADPLHSPLPIGDSSASVSVPDVVDPRRQDVVPPRPCSSRQAIDELDVVTPTSSAGVSPRPSSSSSSSSSSSEVPTSNDGSRKRRKKSDAESGNDDESWV